MGMYVEMLALRCPWRWLWLWLCCVGGGPLADEGPVEPRAPAPPPERLSRLKRLPMPPLPALPALEGEFREASLASAAAALPFKLALLSVTPSETLALGVWRACPWAPPRREPSPAEAQGTL